MLIRITSEVILLSTHNIGFYRELTKIIHSLNEPRREKTVFFAYAKTKTQISFAVTAKLISVFVFATLIVQSLYFLNPEFQASSHLLWLYSSVCVRPGRKPRRPVFSQLGSNNHLIYSSEQSYQVWHSSLIRTISV